jgi:hypothetical protein
VETVIIRTTQKGDDSDPFAVLEQTIQEAGFWDRLEECFIKSGRVKERS